MAMFKTLKDMKKSTEARVQSDGDRVPRYFTVKNGESFSIRFRQELAEDSAGYTDEAGGAEAILVHSNPNNFKKQAVCTADSEENNYRCWACEQVAKDRGWKAKKHLLVNVAVFDPDEGVWNPRVLDQKFTSAHVAQSVVDYAEAYDTLLDRDYKISRTGTKQQTNYNLIPLAPKDSDPSIADLPMHDLTNVYRTYNYAEQTGFYISEEDTAPASSGDWS